MKDKIHALFAEGGILSGLMAVIAVIYPVCALFSKQANDVLFWLLVVLSIGVVFCRKGNGYSFSRFLKDYWPLWLAMSLLFFAELSNQLFATRLRFSLLLSEPFRFVLFPLLVYGWFALPSEKLRLAGWGWMLCAVAGGVFLFFISGMGKFRPNTWDYIGTLALIPFTNLLLITGLMAVLAMKWGRTGRKSSLIFGGVILCAVIGGLYASQTRASWLIALILFGIAGGFFYRENKKMVSTVGGVIFCVALCLFFASSGKWLDRFKLIQSDIAQYQDGNADTSIGARLQIWQASWIIFTEHPWVGIGGRGDLFRDTVAQTDLVLAPETKRLWHAHNEVLQRMARYGFPGGIAIIAVFLVPFVYFVSYIRVSDPALRKAAFMGVTYNLAFFLFGLSDLIFEWRVAVQFYIVILSVLLAILMKQKEAVLHQS